MHSTRLLLAALLLPAFLTIGRAERTPAPVITANPAVPVDTPPPPTLTFNIDFPGGPLSTFLDAVARLDRVSLSIVGAEGPPALTAKLPAFQLRNVDVMTVTHMLRMVLEPQGLHLEPIGRPDPNSVVCVVRSNREEKPAPRVTPAGFESYQLAPFLGAQTVDDIVGALRAAWELDPSHTPDALKVKYHPPTSILLVSGPPDSLQLVRSVLAQLKSTSERDRQQQVADEIQRRRAERERAGPPASPEDKR